MLVKEAIPASQTLSRALQQHLFSLLQQNCKTFRRITEIHTQIIVNGFTQKNFILVNLLHSYISSGYLHHAYQAFEQIKNPSTTVWNQIIRGETPLKSLELYNEMQATEASPDGHTYSYVISACAKEKLLREGEQVHGRVLSNGYYSNVFVGTNLVYLYATAGGVVGMKSARHLFDETCDRNVVTWNTLLAGYLRHRDFEEGKRIFDEMYHERNVVSWTIMISGLAQGGRCRQALSLFKEMKRARVELDQVTLVAVLSACAEIGDLKMGRWIHSYIDKILCITDHARLVRLNNALIHMYASCGVIEEAYELFKQMPYKTTISWTTMITGFAKQARGKEALSVFKWMVSTGENAAIPDAITMLGVLYACNHSGFVYEGCHFFKCMNEIWGIEPRIEHYGCMVDLLSRAGLLDEAHKLVDNMPLEPNDVIWGAVLGGCRIHKNVELASRVAQKLVVVELDPEKAAGYLVLLSNVYAAAKRWKDVVNVRQKMVDLGVRKPPGRSWVQIDGTIHDFLAGDKSHKHASLIYEMLVLVTSEADLAGYKPDILEPQVEVGF